MAIASLSIDIGANISGAMGGLSKLSDTLDSSASTLKDWGGKFTAGFTLPIAAGFAAVIAAASDNQTVMTQLNAVLTSTGGKAGVTADMAINLANSLEGVTRYSHDAVLGGEDMLLTFTNIGQDVFPQATETILNMSTALGQDLKTSAIQLGKALNDPVKGMTALSRVGVTFTDEQKKMVAQMVATGDVMGAQKVILAELNTEFGNSAEMAGTTFAGKLDILKNKFLDILQMIGGPIIDVLGAFVSGITEAMNGITSLDPTLVLLGASVAVVVAAIGPLLTLFGIMTGPIGLVTGAVLLFGKAWNDNFGNIQGIVGSAYDAVKPILDNLKQIVSDFFNQLTAPKAAANVAPSLGDMQDAGGAYNKMKNDDAGGFGAKLATAIKNAVPQITAALSDLINAGVTWLQTTGAKMIGDAAGKVGDALKKGLGDALAALGPNVVVPIIIPLGLLAIVLGVLATVTAGGAIATAISGLAAAFWALDAPLFPILAPLALIGAIIAAYQSNFLGVRDAINKFGDAIKTNLAPGGSVSKFINGIADDISKIYGAALDAWNKILDLIAAITGIPAHKTVTIDEYHIGHNSDGSTTTPAPTGGTTPTKAGGGSVSAGNLYQVGEGDKPELFMIPGDNGSVISNDQLSRIGGGGGNKVTVQNITLHAYGVNDPVRLVNMIDDELERRNKDAVGRG